MTEAIQTINGEFQVAVQKKIAALAEEAEADIVEVSYEGDRDSQDISVMNWADVLGVYAVKVSMDETEQGDVTVVTAENIGQLRAIFRAIARHDVERAGRLARAHCTTARDDLLALVAR